MKPKNRKRSKIYGGSVGRAVLCVVMAMLMIVPMPLTALAYDEESVKFDYIDYDNEFLGDLKVKNGKAQGVIEYLYMSYGGSYHRFKGAGQCYGYAEATRKLFGSSYKQKNHRVKATKANLYKKLKHMKPGTHVRFTAKKNGSGSAHSIVLLKITKKKIWYTDANMDWNNGIGIYTANLSDISAWVTSPGRYKWLVWTREPRGSIPSVNKMKIKAICVDNGPNANIAWRPVKKAKKYIVYRSKTKSGKYSKIATVKGCHYTDKSTDLIGNAWYKVKAVKSGKTISTSKPKKAMRRVKAPKAYLTENYNEDTGSVVCEITIDPVKGATKYNVYKWNEKKERFVKIKTIEGTSWIYKPKSNEYYLDLAITAEGRKGSESLPVSLTHSLPYYED